MTYAEPLSSFSRNATDPAASLPDAASQKATYPGVNTAPGASFSYGWEKCSRAMASCEGDDPFDTLETGLIIRDETSPAALGYFQPGHIVAQR